MSGSDSNRVPVQKNRGGEWITFGDEQYRVPPLAFRAVQDLAAEIEALKDISGTPTGEQMRTVEKLVHAAMARNYQSLTQTDVADMLDLGNYREVLEAVLSIGGYRKGASPGEAVTASTGTGFTPP